ncbi:hypothetical protein [Kitasatospora sp. NPDC059327]|uniref:hypothetical protein n=1 Tax=Kitasatospora sp. NPDC059327 TaxID=3346803 RepID=UPI0036B84E47
MESEVTVRTPVGRLHGPLVQPGDGALELIDVDPRHPGLRTHRYRALPGHGRHRVFDFYIETGAGAWRIYWT